MDKEIKARKVGSLVKCMNAHDLKVSKGIIVEVLPASKWIAFELPVYKIMTIRGIQQYTEAAVRDIV